MPVTELPQPTPAAEVILADATPYRHAPRVAGEGHIRPAQKQALELATVIVPKAMGFDAQKPNGWAVQLGAIVGALPYVFILLGFALLLIAFPAIVTWLPGQM